MGRRSETMRLDLLDARATKAANRISKQGERARREVRMHEKLKAGTLPYSPNIMSWLSRQLDKKSARITTEDVKQVVSSAAANGSARS